MPGNKVDSLGVPTFNVSRAFQPVWKDAGSKKVDSLGVPKFNVCIVFYIWWYARRHFYSRHQQCAPCTHSPLTHRANKNRVWCGQGDTCSSISSMWPHSTLLLCFTRFETMPGNKIDSLGVPTFNASKVFDTLWENIGEQNWFPGRAHIQRCYCVLHDLGGCRVTNLICWE
jgi:hypothetical protein